MANAKKYYRNANGQGTVYKLSGNRRRPWVAAITVSWETDMETGKHKQKQKPIGYFEDRASALAALTEYNKDPYDLSTEKLTFTQVYEEWTKDYFETIVPSATRTIKSAYNHSKDLHDMQMVDIKVKHLEEAIRNAQVGDSIKARMKSMYNLMYKYAIKHEIVEKDYAALCKSVKVGVNAPKLPFTHEEITTLWKNLDTPYVKMILIGIYSGWRPQELATLETSDINLEELTMFGGMKTDAGRNRLVPIHEAIVGLIKEIYDKNNKYLFYCTDGTNMTYDKYYKRFIDTMKSLNMVHKPHETRHTFITLSKTYNVDEYALKLIVGHKIQDITEKVYNHRTIDNLRIEINKIKAPSL